MRGSSRSLAGRDVYALAVGFLLVLWLTLEADVTVRPAHYSGFLGFGLSQLLGIALYARERASG